MDVTKMQVAIKKVKRANYNAQCINWKIWSMFKMCVKRKIV
jgi:hypothetical protein